MSISYHKITLKIVTATRKKAINLKTCLDSGKDNGLAIQNAILRAEASLSPECRHHHVKKPKLACWMRGT